MPLGLQLLFLFQHCLLVAVELQELRALYQRSVGGLIERYFRFVVSQELGLELKHGSPGLLFAAFQGQVKRLLRRTEG